MVEIELDSDQLITTPAPHLAGTKDTTRKIMNDVLISLLPATAAGIYFFGLSALLIIGISTFTAIITEAVVLKRRFSFYGIYGDGSAAVTGLLLALTLPPNLPLPMVITGAVIAILIGKLSFGGLGFNIFNPALVGRLFLLVLWPVYMTYWIDPVDGTAAATPLAGAGRSYFDLFVGRIASSIGEASALLILIGALYLLIRGRIGWRIPVSYIGSVAVLSLLIGSDILLQLLGGGLLLGAFFMATDMVTSPVTRHGKLIFGLGCGVITLLIREFASLPEGVMFGILMMNAFTPLLDKYCSGRTFGERAK